MSNRQENEHIPYIGQKIEMVCEAADTGERIFTAQYEVVPAPSRPELPPEVYDLKLLSREWASPEMEAFHTIPADPRAPADADPAGTALEVTKFAWDFIKDNKPVADVKDTTTSVIIKGTDSLDYANAREFSTDTYRFIARDKVIKDWVLVDVNFRLEGTYHATPAKPDIPFGHYLPSVHFNVLNVFVGWTFNLEGHAEVSAASNLGPADDVQPQVRLYAKLKLSWIFQTNAVTFGFVANGLTGGHGKGPQNAAALETVAFDGIHQSAPAS